MRSGIEERLREHVARERAQVPVPPQMALRILRAVDASRPVPIRRRAGTLQFAAGMAFVLVLAAGIAWMRTSQMPAAVVNGTWSSAASMAVPRGYHTATLLRNGKVLVVGGRGLSAVSAPWQRPGSAISSAELYDPKTRTWSSAGTLNFPRFEHTATLLANGKVLVVGGNQTLANGNLPVGADPVSSAELYDPQTNSWSSAASMRTARALHTATLLNDGRLLVAGGTESSLEDPSIALASAELYDPTANTWTASPPMASARANQSATLLSDHRVLVIGGINRILDYPTGTSPAAGLSTAELFDPATNSWSPTPSMGYTRISPSTTLLPNGRVLVVGDYGVNEQTAEIYDPALQRWLDSPQPIAGHAGHLAVLLHNGVVLIAGGLGEARPEWFDWRRDSWASAGTLSTIRSGATATVLENGQVLVAGGFGIGSRALVGRGRN